MGSFTPHALHLTGHVGDYKAWMAAGVARTHSPLALRCMTKAVPQLPVPCPHIFTDFHVPSPPSLSAIPFTFKEGEPCVAGPSWPRLHDYTLHCRGGGQPTGISLIKTVGTLTSRRDVLRGRDHTD